LLQAQTELKQFESCQRYALVESFQPSSVYYYAGLANNQLKQYKKAKDFLEMGMDYVVENRKKLIQYSIRRDLQRIGDFKKKDFFFYQPIN
jgi:hypothetical protein